MGVSDAWNGQYIDSLYAMWADDPEGVSPEWRAFFEGFELGSGAKAPAPAAGEAMALQAKVEAMIHRHRDLGHLMACLDPLVVCPTSHPLLDLDAFELGEADLDREVYAPGFSRGDVAPVREILKSLRETYCRSIGVEYLHLQDPAEREWLRERMEATRNRADFGADEMRRILKDLTRASRFEEFLQKRYLGQTRFSLEGAEVMLPLLDALVRAAGHAGVEEVVLGMAHRGRLNVQVHLLGKSYEDVFCQFEASYDPDAVPGGGDVKYHGGFIGEVDVSTEKRVRVVLPANPSHLEAVNPVIEGITRALQDRAGDAAGHRVLPLLIHGDAAFPGQGIVSETLNLSRLEGYGTGGTVHLVLNNQIGYTTLPEHARSTRYATDVAKMLMVPIFHVHGENPEAVIFAGRLALDYRMAFGKDAVIDLVCYRRHGHNEGDEPYFTQPLLYDRIRERPPVYEIYGRALVENGVLGEADVAATAREIDEHLESAHEAARSKPCAWRLPEPWDGWEGIGSRYSHTPMETGVDREQLRALAWELTEVPQGFSINPKLGRILERRREALEGEGRLDWAWAESLAFGSLLAEGASVRLSGEDSGRGTFSQRHCVWFDTKTGESYVPLANLEGNGAGFRVYDSPLSEAGVVGFEYGYSVVEPNCLVAWEAQYGDFANGAQVIVDQFVTSGELKWQRPSGLVLLLPHGYEGQGPDHSTGRPERYLQLCAEDNLQVCQPSTPAQYFHLLRRQLKRPFRKPLVVLTPKSLLRHPEVVSGVSDLTSGSFRELLDDPHPLRESPRRVLLCTGKIYYDLADRRRKEGAEGTAILRLEQFYPFPEARLAELAEEYGRSAQWCWVQEEPRNLGGWTFVAPHLEAVLGGPATYVGRLEAGSPATGFPFIHREEQQAIVDQALGGEA